MIKKCQVFTPAHNVIELLDSVGYISDLQGKKVIENACGDGNILKVIVQRYIEDALNKNKSRDEIKRGLQRDIVGAEIDSIHYNNCINNLNMVAKCFEITNVQWNILNGDFLQLNIEDEFDYVIGNPPYITYRDLDDEARAYLKENYVSCRQGKFDYCYAFIEASLKCLKDNGKLAYLIPSSIFKNVFAQELRNMILPNVLKIIDYTTQKLFEKALTSSAVLVCEKGVFTQHIVYHDVANKIQYNIAKGDLNGKWIFSKNRTTTICSQRFGDFFTASISIATLLNKAYILKEFTEEENYIICGDYKIERSVVRVGVSPRSLNYKKDELIIYPYSYQKGILVRYSEAEFEEKFPEATKYLMSQKEKLDKRKSDNGIEWFEYGRSQALAHLDQPKLLLSTVVTKEVKVYELNRECIPYSGIYIIPKQDISLEKAKEILQGPTFYNYVKGIGINASGSSLRITAVDVNDFRF